MGSRKATEEEKVFLEVDKVNWDALEKVYRVSQKKGWLVERDYSEHLMHSWTSPYKSIDFNLKPCHPEAWGPVVYSLSLWVVWLGTRMQQNTREVSFH